MAPDWFNSLELAFDELAATEMLEEGPVFGSAPAALASLLFDPPEPQIIGKTEKHSVSRLSYLFAHLHLLSSDSFSSTLLSSNLSLLSDPFHLCFSSVHIVGSLTSKLPSTKLAQTRCSTTEYHKTCTNTFQYYRILQSLHKHVPVLPYTTKTLHKHVPVLPYTTKTLHKHVPVLPYTTKLRQTRSSTAVYYKACTNTFPVLPYTTKFAQTRSSTTVYYKACTKSFPVLPCTTKLAQTHSSTTVY